MSFSLSLWPRVLHVQFWTFLSLWLWLSHKFSAFYSVDEWNLLSGRPTATSKWNIHQGDPPWIGVLLSLSICSFSHSQDYSQLASPVPWTLVSLQLHGIHSMSHNHHNLFAPKWSLSLHLLWEKKYNFQKVRDNTFYSLLPFHISHFSLFFQNFAYSCAWNKSLSLILSKWIAFFGRRVSLACHTSLHSRPLNPLLILLEPLKDAGKGLFLTGCVYSLLSSILNIICPDCWDWAQASTPLLAS